MTLFPSFALAALSLLGRTNEVPSTNLQPGINPVPSLPGNFSNAPNYWRHATPLLQSPGIPEFPSLVQRQDDAVWTGWGDISYLFSL